MTLERMKKEDFDAVYAQMEQCFPREERRERAHAEAMLCDPRFCILHVLENGERVGFITLWELESFTFIEHFVTYEAHRNKGLGARVLRHLQGTLGTLVLECEPPEAPLAARRLHFYERTGFCQNDVPYLQPAYREGEQDVPLVLMSYPCVLKDPAAAIKQIYRTVYQRRTP